MRKWVREYDDDPSQSFPGKGQMKPEQLEIEKLRREVAKLKTERDILKKPPRTSPRMQNEVRVYQGASYSVQCAYHVLHALCSSKRILRMDEAAFKSPSK